METTNDKKSAPVRERLQRDVSFYPALAIVGLVWAITPASWAYVAFNIWQCGFRVFDGGSTLQKVVLLWSIAEVCFHLTLYACSQLTWTKVIFSVYHTYVFSKLAKLPSQTPLVELSQLNQGMRRILRSGMGNIPVPPHSSCPLVNSDSKPVPRRKLSSATVPLLDPTDPRAIDIRESFSTWFIDPETNKKPAWESLSRGHMLTWLSWSMFVESFEELDHSCQMLVDNALELLERRAGMRLADKVPEGERRVMKPMRLSVDPVCVWSRPAVSYFVVNAADWLAKQWYRLRYGATFGVFGDIE